MPSLIPGYEYDIFISYRQNDNRSGWVTEFVHHLNEELAATIKEPISIYFDVNPHDGLLETHDVDKSLEGKLKCLIFIPIISQTYCDPKSFAWKNELLAFKKIASEDQFSLKVKLSNGNVASRILPVRIHELDESDKAILENEIGPLRAIDFIFKSAGVNRPLLAHEEHPQDNLNKTFYRDQINKVANAVKEIVSTLKSSTDVRHTHVYPTTEISVPEGRRKKLSLVAGMTLLLSIISFSIFYFTVFKNNIDPKENSIAVLPFTNLSNDPDQEYFCDGTTEQVISSLARLKDLKVIARTSVLQYKNTTKTIAQIGKELNVTHVLESSVRKSGNQIRVTAQLIAVKDETHLWAEDFDNKVVADIFQIQDAVAARIASSLKSKLLPEEKERLASDKPSSPEAYEHYLKGLYIHFNYYAPHNLAEDFNKAEKEFKLAIHLDTTYASAYAAIADLYDTRSKDAESNAIVSKYADIAYRLNPTLPYALVVKFQSWNERAINQTDSLLRAQQLDSAYKYISKAYLVAPNDVSVCSELGTFLGYVLGLYKEGILLLKHSVKINPAGIQQLSHLSRLNYFSGDNVNAKKYITEALTIDPNNLLSSTVSFRINCDEMNYQEAANILEKTKAVNASFGAIHFMQSYLLASKGDREKAIALIGDVPLVFRPDIFIQLKLKTEALREIKKELREGTRINYIYLQRKALDFLKGDPRFEKILAQTKMRYEVYLKKYGNLDLPED